MINVCNNGVVTLFIEVISVICCLLLNAALEPPKQVPPTWAALAGKNTASAVVQGSVASQPKPQATVKPEIKPETTPVTAPLPQR